MKLAIQLFAIAQVLKYTARRHAAFGERIKQKNMVAQLKLQDDSVATVHRISQWKDIFAKWTA